MSMQIKSIFLYNKNGEIRNLKFEIGKVNIISGKSDTGKSAIIPIIEYCFGKSTFEVPEGVIRKYVKWYAVLYQLENTQIFVAKPAPNSPAAKSQSQLYYEIGVSIAPPPLSSLIVNSNDNSIIETISALLGISSNKTIIDKKKPSNAYEVTVQHGGYYLFQDSDVIASKNILFHKQFEVEWAPKTIKSTLPYFLGVVQEDRLALENKLFEARKRQKDLDRKLNEVKFIASERLDKGKDLLAEAQQVGLLGIDVDRDDFNKVIKSLQETQSWTSREIPSENIEVSQKLEEEIQIFRQQLKEKGRQIEAVEKYIRDAEGYTGEVDQQVLRLESVNILDETHDANTCPLCRSDISSKTLPSVVSIQKTLHQLSSSLQTVKRERPKLIEYSGNLIAERSLISQQIEERRANLRAIEKESDISQQIKNENSRVSRIIGRISFYLENLNLPDETEDINADAKKAQKAVDILVNELDIVNIEDRLNSVLNLISYWMTDWAKLLKLEYSKDYHYQFDLNKLTVQANLPDRIIPMSSMGGGRNILGCHLITLLALHKYFINQKRPIPSFLILDQPTQGFFVNPDIYKKMVEGDLSKISLDDREDILKTFDFIFTVCQELAPNMQVIVLEHANLDTEEFRKALVEEPWRDGRALIPQSWIVDENN